MKIHEGEKIKTVFDVFTLIWIFFVVLWASASTIIGMKSLNYSINFKTCIRENSTVTNY